MTLGFTLLALTTSGLSSFGSLIGQWWADASLRIFRSRLNVIYEAQYHPHVDKPYLAETK